MSGRERGRRRTSKESTSHVKKARRMQFRPNGLIPAAFTPLKADGSLHLERIPALVDHLERDGVSGIYVLGSTGEGISLSSRERRKVAETYVQAAKERLPVIVQVGHNSLTEARQLAEHAQRIGADAISAVLPSYFKPESLEKVVECLEVITAGAPELPFYYYHIPMMTGIELDVVDLLRIGSERLPTLTGVKFSDHSLHEFQKGRQFQDGAFNFLFGADEMLLSSLVVGGQGAVGSTYNFAAPLYWRVIEAFKQGDLKQARHFQGLAVKMVDCIMRRCGRAGLKAMMALVGVDCGPHRLPQRTAPPEAVAEMERELEDMGFFEWGRRHQEPV